METSQSVPELVATARAKAKTFEDRIAEILNLAGDESASDAQAEELRAATVALELEAIDIFSLFEARMQHHFKRGPFSRKLISLLQGAKETDLAERIRQYYLAVNVLKHGKGASYRALLNEPAPLVTVKSADEQTLDETQTPTGLVDVRVPGFFEGLTTTILNAHKFLENK